MDTCHQPGGPAQGLGEAFWLEPVEAGRWRLGVHESFLETLEGGEVVGVELLPAGTRVSAGQTFGFLHTPNATVDLRAPRALRLLEINPALAGNAALVRRSPYAQGWLAICELPAE